MTTTQEVLRKMSEVLDKQKRNINQLYIIRHKAISDLYRTNNYEIQIEGHIHKLDALFEVYERWDKKQENMTDNDRKRYAQLLNSIATELQFLKATSEAMDEHLQSEKKSGDI